MIFMNGYNRCCGMMSPMRKEYLQPQMMYAMPATQQMPVKTEMVKVPETKETKCETKVPVMPQSQMMCPAPVMPQPQMCQTQMQCCPMPVHYETCCQVIEPTVCCMPEVHHHHRVEHVVPVVVKTVHHHHNHHDYVICKEEGMECHQYDHGLRNEDWCALAMQPQCPHQPKRPLC